MEDRVCPLPKDNFWQRVLTSGIIIMKNGAAGEIRTPDLPLTKGVLYP